MPHTTKGPEPQLVARTSVVVSRVHYLITANLITAGRLGSFSGWLGGFASGRHTRHYFS
jgi:hypothetical protein